MSQQLTGHKLSPVASGIRMLPLLLLSSFGAGLARIMCRKKDYGYATLVAAIGLQVFGVGLMSTLPTQGPVSSRQYAYRALLGLGFDMSLISVMITARLAVRHGDLGMLVSVINRSDGRKLISFLRRHYHHTAACSGRDNMRPNIPISYPTPRHIKYPLPG